MDEDKRGSERTAVESDQLDEVTRDAQPIEDTQQGRAGVSLRLLIRDSETPLSITLTGEAIIGRRGPNSEETPDIDLTLYGGYKKGVSRYHAVLHAQDAQLRLTDLDSRNGTFLNGHRVPGRQTALVNDGDEIRLGQVVLQVQIADDS